MNGDKHIRGITLLELMVVVAIVGILAALAIPAISTYSEPQKQRGALRRVVDTFAFGRAQAKRLNRAVFVEISQFDKQRPKGLIELYQGISGNCTLTAERREAGDAALLRLRRVPFGQTVRGQYQGDVEEKIGLTEWVRNNGVGSADTLTLCLSPDGSVHRVLGAAALPIVGKLTLLMQFFDHAAGGLAPRGGADRIAINFSGSVRHEK